MRCDEIVPLLGAYADRELPEPARAEIEGHLAGCANCAARSRSLAGLSAALREQATQYRAPSSLQARIRQRLRDPDCDRSGYRPVARLGGLSRLAYAASLVMACGLGVGGTLAVTGRQAADPVAGQVLDSHLRALLGTHAVDIPSSAQHTVRPWFAGRTDIAPPAIDLAAQGFPLIGGRLDLIAGKPVPALVYKRREHMIDLFIVPARPGAGPEVVERRGYAIRRWRDADLDYWAASDAGASELAEFERLFRAGTGRDRPRVSAD